MSLTFLLIILAVALSLVATALHVFMIVQGFKVSTQWGLIPLLVPFGSIIFAFSKFDSPKRTLWAMLLLFTFLSAILCMGVASYKTAKAKIGSHETAAQGMIEAEDQINALENLDDLQLDL